MYMADNYRKASISARPCIVPEPRIVPEFYSIKVAIKSTEVE